MDIHEHLYKLLKIVIQVLGCELPNGSFVEGSNFHISSVKMKVKIHDVEAGWIVTVSDVLGEEEEK